MFLDTFEIAQNVKCSQKMLCGKSVVAASDKYKQMQIILIDCLFIVDKKIKTTSGTCPGCVLTRGILYYPAEMFSINQQWVNALVKYIVKLHVSAVRLPFVDDGTERNLISTTICSYCTSLFLTCGERIPQLRSHCTLSLESRPRRRVCPPPTVDVVTAALHHAACRGVTPL